MTSSEALLKPVPSPSRNEIFRHRVVEVPRTGTGKNDVPIERTGPPDDGPARSLRSESTVSVPGRARGPSCDALSTSESLTL